MLEYDCDCHMQKLRSNARRRESANMRGLRAARCGEKFPLGQILGLGKHPRAHLLHGAGDDGGRGDRRGDRLFFGAQTMAQFDFHHFETQGIISYVLPSIRKGLFGGAMAGLLLGDLFCKSKRKLDTKIIAASCVAALAIVVAAGFIAEAEYASRGFVDLSALGSPSAELMRG